MVLAGKLNPLKGSGSVQYVLKHEWRGSDGLGDAVSAFWRRHNITLLIGKADIGQSSWSVLTLQATCAYTIHPEPDPLHRTTPVSQAVLAL